MQMARKTLLAVCVVSAAVYVAGYQHGSSHIQSEWEQEKNRLALARQNVSGKQMQSTAQVVTKYVDRVRVIREATEPIIKQVTVYVPDTVCDIPAGFVSLHNATAKSDVRVPQAASSPDDASTGTDLTAVATVVAENYTRCHENTEKLRALQRWVRRMQQTTESTGD